MSYYTNVKVIMRKADYDYMINCPPDWMLEDGEDELAYTKRFPITYGSKKVWTKVDESEYKHLDLNEQLKYIQEHQTQETIDFVIIDVGDTNHFPSRIEYLWDTVEKVPTEYMLIDEDHGCEHVDNLGTDLLYREHETVVVFDNYIKGSVNKDSISEGVVVPLVDKVRSIVNKGADLSKVTPNDLLTIFDYIEQLTEERNRLRNAVVSMKEAAENVIKIEV